MVVLVDFSWVLHKCVNAYKLSASVGGQLVSTGGLYGLLRAILAIQVRVPFNTPIILCCDSKINDRKQLDLNYKANRVEHSYVYASFDEILTSCSLFYNVFVTQCVGYEADDLIYSFSQSTEERCLLYALDSDLYQCLAPNVEMFDKFTPTGFDVRDSAQLLHKYLDIQPSQVALFKAITGDSSDNIKGLLRFPRKHLKIFFESPFIISPAELFHISPPISSKKYFNRILESAGLISKNFELTKLRIVKARVLKLLGSWEFIELYKFRSIRNQMKPYLCRLKNNVSIK